MNAKFHPAERPADDHEQQLAAILSRLTDAVQRGEPTNLDDACREHPDFADELRELWWAVLAADVVGSSPVTEDAAVSFEVGGVRRTLPCHFGDYELISELGRGGMGVVYLAKQVRLGRQVAIKMILRGPFATPTDLSRFQAEAAAAAQVHHPGIVPVFEVGEVNGQPYFSMKYVTGTTLLQRLADGPMPPREAAQVLAKVARAIQCAHEHGVLHRDLKPSNILIDDAGEPHVSDFGLAKQIEGAESLTRTGTIIGTPSYMAPEQAAGDRGEVGPASDVYSLGSILYHMLTGRPPFQAASPVDTVLNLLEQEVVPPRMLNPSADPDLELIALRCLQKPIDLRYLSAAALADDLDAYLQDEPISARSGHFAQIVAAMFRDTHHAIILQNWGLLWMWHSLALLVACLLTNLMQWSEFTERWYYIGLWTFGLGTWASVFWWLRRRMGPVTFVERQIAHVWAASMVATGMLFVVEIALNLPVLTLSPVLGLVTGMVFLIKAGMLSGTFYVQSVALFATSLVMAQFPAVAHLIFGIVAALSFFVPGWKYHRQRQGIYESRMRTKSSAPQHD